MAQQTAVDWFAKQVEENLGWYPVDLIKEANQMFEEQIIAACNQTDVIGLDHEQPGQQYYNKTYKTGNNGE